MPKGKWFLIYSVEEGRNKTTKEISLVATTEAEAIVQAQESWLRIRQYVVQQRLRSEESGHAYSQKVSRPQVHFVINLP